MNEVSNNTAKNLFSYVLMGGRGPVTNFQLLIVSPNLLQTNFLYVQWGGGGGGSGYTISNKI